MSEAPPREQSSKGLRGAYSRRFQLGLLAYLIAFSFICSVTAGYIFYTRQIKFVQADQQTRGKTLISNLAGQSELGAYSGDRAFLVVPARRTFSENDVSFTVIYSISGKPLIEMVKFGTKVDRRVPPHLLQELRAGQREDPIRINHPDYDDLLAPIVTIKGDVEQSLFGTSSGVPLTVTIGVARLGLSHRPAQQKLDEVLRWGIILSGIVMALGVVLALVLARRISRPIRALARGADEVSSGNLGFQVQLNRSDELGLLAESFNRMSSGLQETVESLADLNRTLEHKVARRTEDLRESRDFVTLLNVPLQLLKLLDNALAALMQYTGAPAGAVFLASAADAAPELKVFHGAPEEAFGDSGDRLPAYLVHAVRTPHVVVLEPLPASCPLADQCSQVQALVLLPVHFQDQFGAVVLGVTQPPGQERQAFLDSAAGQLTIAVANASAFAAVKLLARELERRNLALLTQRDQLQEAGRLKSEFLTNVSHELRTPLNAILGYTELVADEVFGAVNDEQRQSLEGIAENTASLLELINDILDLSKVEAGKLTVELREVDLVQLIKDVVDSTASLTRDRPYTVFTELPERPMRVLTDGGLVRQILVNLLSNAIKFTAEGAIRISLEAARGGDVQIEVEDTGVGIRSESMDFIFDAFRQVDGSSTREHGGTGLGLTISKQYAALLGGDIHATSTPGKGSTFTLVLTSAKIAPEEDHGETN